jgi:integrase
MDLKNMAKKIKGMLYCRGTAGHYYLQYSVNGEKFRQVLTDADNKPITDYRKAEKARDLILDPYRAADIVQRRQQAVSALNTAKEIVAIATERVNPPLTIADAWQAYSDDLSRPQSGERTLKNYQGHWEQFQAWLLMQPSKFIYLRDITAETAKLYAISLNKSGKSANTYNKHISFLKLFFKILATPGKITDNPFKAITQRNLETKSRRELTIEELHKILNNATGDMALLLALGIFTGLRLGDCCTLRWDEVNLINRIIKRLPNKTARAGKLVKVGIPAPLYERLNAVPPSTRGEYVLPIFANDYQRKGNGRIKITRKIQDYLQSIGINTHQAGTGKRVDDTGKIIDSGKRAVVSVGFHSLRHTYVSIHAMSGTPQAIIQGNVGHSNPAMTAHYTHTTDEAARRVAGALDTPFIDVTPLAVEPERQQLKELADTLPIKKIRAILKKLNA